MRNRAVASRYASALLATAEKGGVLDGVAESFAGVMEVLGRDEKLRRVLTGPQIDEGRKKALVDEVFGGRIEPTLRFFFHLLLEKQRMGFVGEIHDEFVRQVEQARGFTRARVTTAVPLPDDLREELKAKLATLTGHEIALQAEIDPAVIGGVVVAMGDRVIDGTVRTNLERLRRQLSQADVRQG